MSSVSSHGVRAHGTHTSSHHPPNHPSVLWRDWEHPASLLPISYPRPPHPHLSLPPLLPKPTPAPCQPPSVCPMVGPRGWLLPFQTPSGMEPSDQSLSWPPLSPAATQAPRSLPLAPTHCPCLPPEIPPHHPREWHMVPLGVFLGTLPFRKANLKVPWGPRVSAGAPAGTQETETI